MSADIYLKLEQAAYPTGAIASEGENLRKFTINSQTYTPPIQLDGPGGLFLPIFIPTKRNIMRNRKNIKRIMRLAAKRDNSLAIFLCSGPASKDDIETLANETPGLSWLAINGPFSYDYSLTKLKTTLSPLSYGTEKDQAQKRNFALRLARQMGWESVFFLDDDVAVTSAQLNKAHRLLQAKDVAAVGFSAREFPDNSVAMHAHRWVRNSIDSFMGAGALAVKTNTPFLSFFPHIYNEDWMFLLTYRLLGAGNLIWAGTIKQRRFNPYNNFRRAMSEEVGDLVAESLFKLALVLCDSEQFKDIKDLSRKFRIYANEEFWNIEINNRLHYLRELQEELKKKRLNPIKQRQARWALDHAIERILGHDGHSGVTGKELADWTRAWCQDIATWNSAPLPIHPSKTLTDAFATLGLSNDFSYQTSIDQSKRTSSAVTKQPSTPRRVAVKPYTYTGHTLQPRTQATLEGLWLTKTVQNYLDDKELHIEKIVTSADMLRFDRPTHWLTNVKPLATVSVIVAYGESVAQICTTIQNIAKWSEASGPLQLLIWVYGDAMADNKHALASYRNRVIAQVLPSVTGTHVQIRSSVITPKREGINRVIDQMFNDISVAYWKQHIRADHPIYVANSEGELLRFGTYCQFMRQEQLLPRHSLKHVLTSLPSQPRFQKITKQSDKKALHVARAALARPQAERHIPNPQLATKQMVYRMKQAKLTWLQLDDLAYNVAFHSSAGEESVEYIKQIRCLPVIYRNDLPANKQGIAREIIRIMAETPAKPTAFMIIVQGESDNSWEEIEQYRQKLMEFVREYTNNTNDSCFVSMSYRLAPGETSHLAKRRILATAEYIHWLQNHANRVRISWLNEFTKQINL